MIKAYKGTMQTKRGTVVDNSFDEIFRAHTVRIWHVPQGR